MVGFQRIKSALNSISSPSQTKHSPSRESAQLVKQNGPERELLFARHPKFSQICMGDSAVLSLVLNTL